MPLCELRLPINSLVEEGKDVCDVALKATLEYLNIPDPEDREYRIIKVGSSAEPEIEVHFGTRADQYDQDNLWVPTVDQMEDACKQILTQTRAFGIRKVSLFGWKDAAFMTRPLEKPETELLVPERFKNGIEVKGDIAIRMIFSPSVLENLKLDLENNEETFKNILELFKGEGGVDLQFPLEAETEIGVEVDFVDIGDENKFSPEEMAYLMYRVENCLDLGSASDRSKKTTIWLRQGEPVLFASVGT